MLVQALVEAPLTAVTVSSHLGKVITGMVMRDVRVHPNTMLEIQTADDPLSVD